MKRVFILLALLLALPQAYAVSVQDCNVSFGVVHGTVAAEYEISLAETGAELGISAPGDAHAISAYVNGRHAEAVLRETGNGDFEIAVPLGADSKSVRLSFLTDSLVERTSKSFFVANLKSLVDAQNLNAVLALPEGAVLDKPLGTADASVFPKPQSAGTNGQAISLNWSFGRVSAGDSFPMLVVYREPGSFDFAPYLLPAVLVVLAVVLVLYVYRKKPFVLGRAQKKQAHPQAKKPETGAAGKAPGGGLDHLLEDERRIVELLGLAKDNELKQKELLRNVDFSKAKLSRLLRNLEQRGFVESKPYGNTNIIKLKL